MWRTMKEWQDSGPPNPERMLLLLADGVVTTGYYDSIQWWEGRRTPGDEKRYTPLSTRVVAWQELPKAPDELFTRIAYVKRQREALKQSENSISEMESAPLALGSERGSQ